MFAAQPGLLVGVGAETVPPVPALVVSAQQRWKVAPSVLAAAGIVNVVDAVPSVVGPFHASNA
jgi:hypothetical protein